jgi:hypothetical protein
MTPAQLAEARRWVALRGWRWMPGMLANDGWRVLVDFDDGSYLLAGGNEARVCSMTDGEAPDLTDPATAGCLLALAREITGRPGLFAHPSPGDGGWVPCYHAPSGAIDWIRRVSPTETGAYLDACEQHEADT